MLKNNGFHNRHSPPFRFSVLSLFANGEQGVWYDPSDFSTLFQDSAGTTAVTAVEQPVGKILDKSGRGNHLVQATAASRPTLSARVNLLTYSEQFDNAAWVKISTTITANATTAPDGTSTADSAMEGVTVAAHTSAQLFTALAATTYTFSVYIKANGRNYAHVWFGAINSGATVDLSAGTIAIITGFNNPDSVSVQSVGDGWYRASVTYTNPTLNAGATATVYISNTGDFALRSYAGDITKGIYIWGASLVPADQASLPYQRIAAATVYDTVGFPHYLKFDGVDDSLATASINFTSTDKMSVFAGVRRLSEAANQIYVELGTGDQNGSFLLLGRTAVTTDRFVSKGTAVSAADASSLPTVSYVKTGIGDISGDILRFRQNGIQIASTTTDQGTGNYGNYPLFIGRRNNATLPFNGHLYSLIVRGAQSTDAQIVSAESYVNSKTGAY
jgi:hypothetical protein